MPSVKETLNAIRLLPGVTAMRTQDAEWRVTIQFTELRMRYPGEDAQDLQNRQEDLAYYTNDADDALRTARDMSIKWLNHGVQMRQEAMKAADAVFQRELERVYGKNAGDARYKYTHDDHNVTKARDDFKMASMDWSHEINTARKGKAIIADIDASKESASKKKDAWESLGKPQREFIEVLQRESQGKFNFDAASEFYERLHDLSLRHFQMCNLSLKGDGLSKKQERVLESLEDEISELVCKLPGHTVPNFRHDPRDATVGIFFDSGAHNSLSGDFKVPLDPNRVREMVNYDFKDEIKALEDRDRSVGPIRHMSLLIDTNSAAFEDLGVKEESARILEYAADQMDDWWQDENGLKHHLRDTNGNVVGHLVFLSEEPALEVARNGEVRACLQYKLNDDAYKDDPAHEVAQILRECAYHIAQGDEIFPVFNSSNDWVGSMEISEIPELELEKDNRIVMEGAFMRTFTALEGIAIGDYCYVVPADGFVPGRGQGEGKAWLVNVKGEKAPGYEEPQTVREADFRALTTIERERLREVVYGFAQFEDFEP